MTNIVLGPPGTGKTTHLLTLVEQALARGVSPDRIGYVSFTRRAADEAVSRAMKRFSLERDQLPYFRTLHSMCFWRLGLTRGEVLSSQHLRDFADWANVRITGHVAEDGSMTGDAAGDRALHVCNLARIRMVSLRQAYEDAHDDLPFMEVDRVDRALRSYKAEHGLMDYTDMLEQYARTDLPARLEELYVDEAQDLSRLQWAVIDRLAVGCPSVTVAGDDDQAIYRWAGADVEHLITLPGTPHVLGQSYRVPVAVQEVALGLMARVANRRPKQWLPRPQQGSTVRVTDLAQADLTQGTVLVLARNVFLAKEVIEPALRRAGVLYEYQGNSSVSPKVLAAVLAWERLRTGAAVSVADARRAYEYMSVDFGVKRGYKQLPGLPDEQMVTMAELRTTGGLLRGDAWFTALDRVPGADMAYITALRRSGERLTGKPRVVVSTIHGAKGGEADHVVLLTDMAQRTFNEMQKVSPEDEARVWYVGVTRARERLTIVAPRTPRHCQWL